MYFIYLIFKKTYQFFSLVFGVFPIFFFFFSFFCLKHFYFFLCHSVFCGDRYRVEKWINEWDPWRNLHQIFWSIEIVRVKKVLHPGVLAIEKFMRISKRKGKGNKNESESQRKRKQVRSHSKILWLKCVNPSHIIFRASTIRVFIRVFRFLMAVFFNFWSIHICKIAKCSMNDFSDWTKYCGVASAG